MVSGSPTSQFVFSKFFQVKVTVFELGSSRAFRNVGPGKLKLEPYLRLILGCGFKPELWPVLALL